MEEKGSQYYYLPVLTKNAVVTLTIHPRWLNRFSPYSKGIATSLSVWAKEASASDRKMTFQNPEPDRDAHERRMIFRQRDDYMKLRTNGSALAAKLLDSIP